MTYYLAGRTSTLKPEMQYSEWVSAGSPAAATRIARRLLAFARKHSADGMLWDGWYVGSSKTQGGKVLIFAQGRAD